MRNIHWLLSLLVVGAQDSISTFTSTTTSSSHSFTFIPLSSFPVSSSLTFISSKASYTTTTTTTTSTAATITSTSDGPSPSAPYTPPQPGSRNSTRSPLVRGEGTWTSSVKRAKTVVKGLTLDEKVQLTTGVGELYSSMFNGTCKMYNQCCHAA